MLQLVTISILAKPEYILHVEVPRIMAGDPAYRPNCSLSEGMSAGCLMRDFHPFAFGGKPDAMFTHDITSPDGFKTNRIALPGPRPPLAPINGNLPKIPPQCLGDDLPHADRRTRGGIDLMSVMRFNDFDVYLISQYPRRNIEQFETEIDAHAHVRGKDNGSLGRS